MLVLHILSKSIVELVKTSMGIAKFTMHIQRIFKLMWLLLMAHLWSPRYKYYIHNILIYKAIPTWHVGAYENNLVLIQGPLNVALIWNRNICIMFRLFLFPKPTPIFVNHIWVFVYALLTHGHKWKWYSSLSR